MQHLPLSEPSCKPHLLPHRSGVTAPASTSPGSRSTAARATCRAGTSTLHLALLRHRPVLPAPWPLQSLHRPHTRCITNDKPAAYTGPSGLGRARRGLDPCVSATPTTPSAAMAPTALHRCQVVQSDSISTQARRLGIPLAPPGSDGRGQGRVSSSYFGSYILSRKFMLNFY